MNQPTGLDAQIVIVGAPRSGTTLLHTILGGHSSVVPFTKELQIFLELHERCGDRPTNREAAIDFVTRHRYHTPEVEAGDLRLALSGSEQATVSDLNNTYLRPRLDRQPISGRPLVKHPCLVLNLETARNWFPAAIFVNVVRDPRANIASRRARWPDLSVWSCISRGETRSGQCAASTSGI